MKLVTLKLQRVVADGFEDILLAELREAGWTVRVEGIDPWTDADEELFRKAKRVKDAFRFKMREGGET